MIKNSTQNFIAMVTLLLTLLPLTSSAQYSWSNDEGGTYNIPSEEYNPINHAFGSSDNTIYNKIGFNPSASNPKTMRIRNVSGSTINMYDFMGNLMPDKALDNRAIGWDWENDDRNGGIIAASIAEIRVGNTNHTMVYAWSVQTDGRRRSGWIKLSDLEDPNGIRGILEDNKDIRMDILENGGINDAIYDEYTVVEATLPAFAEEYYIRAGRDRTKTQGKAKYYYTRDGYISGIKNIMENSRQRYGVAHNNIPLGAKFYKDRNFKQVDVEIYAGVEDEDDYADNHVFTPISERLQIVWGYTVTGAGEKIYSFINNRTLVATGNNDVTNNESDDDDGDDGSDGADSSCDWAKIANENQVMNFSGSKTIRYGANGVYTTKIVTGGTRCSNAVFGDPTPGVLKTCEECKDGDDNNDDDNGDNDDEFTPNPSKVYYIDNLAHNKRLASNGASEDPYTTSTSTNNADTQWKFVAKGNGYWHIQRAAGGSKPRLRTDNTDFADMQETSSSLTYTYFHFPEGKSAGTYHIRLPDGPTNFKRLQMRSNGDLKFVSDAGDGNWESFKITEASNTQTPAPTTGNIAPNGTASQSSTAYGGSASRAIDRNTSGVYSQNSVTHTGNTSRPHWEVKWNDVYVIDEVKIYNRTDCCSDRLSDFRVFVIDDSTGDVTFRQDYSGVSGSSLTINTGGVKGNRVKIRLNGSNFLSLAEVEVFGSLQRNISQASLTIDSAIFATEAVTESMVLYPNPTENNEIRIGFKDNSEKTILITNISGQTLLSKHTSEENLIIDLSRFQRGMYFTKIIYKDGTTDQSTFIKNR